MMDIALSSFLLHVLGSIFTIVGMVLLFVETIDYATVALFWLTGVTAFGFGILADAIMEAGEMRKEAVSKTKSGGNKYE